MCEAIPPSRWNYLPTYLSFCYSADMPHIHDKIDFTVEVFIVYNNNVLLRKHDKHKIWLSVGGHIELDEDPIQAAIREVKEEVGLDISLFGKSHDFDQKDGTKDLIPPVFLNRNRVGPTHEHVTLVYFATATTDTISENIESEKSEECRWFDKEDLLKNKELVPNIKFYALQALEKL